MRTKRIGDRVKIKASQLLRDYLYKNGITQLKKVYRIKTFIESNSGFKMYDIGVTKQEGDSILFFESELILIHEDIDEET